ncbi:hypothetical protein K3175_03260 [Qipengyuania sp. GH1]|uniref:hypothetical protein n=1 Tax=Qipengyuania aestuarii TaxID=2867241 RepID=UPI001C87A82F|nr:hypothetical protein [Qipengyuania aestuarii]MBX7534669.1 hypothetical protein [Qipengyuania aestuarii]
MNKFTILSVASISIIAALYNPANATTFVSRKFECPVGGEKFEANVVASNVSYGQRPDGRPYSPMPVYPIIECPENGLLLIDEEFTEEELSVLEAAIATPEYQAMRSEETPYFRAAWLQKLLGEEPVSQVRSLLNATWETDRDPQRKARYQTLFIDAAMAMPRTEETADEWLWYNLRAVNALRELGNFAKAKSHLERVMQPENLPSNEEQAGYAIDYADRLRPLLEEANSYFEPANMVPPRMAIFRCVAPKSPLTSSEIEACADDDITTAISEYEFDQEGAETLHGRAAAEAAAPYYSINY